MTDRPDATPPLLRTRPGAGVSVFVKLVAIMLAMAASLLLLVGVFFLSIVSPSLNDAMREVVGEYARVVADTRPGLEAARTFGERLGLQIRYEGPAGAWSTDPRMPTIDRVRHQGLTLSTFLGGRGYTVVEAPDGGAYLFGWNFSARMREVHDNLILALFALMAVVVLAAHLVIRRLLRPLQQLHDGVGRFGRGDFDVVLPNRTRDEFGVLTAAFNDMVRRVGDMMRARDRLLLDVSHELRSPLTRMKVALELLPEDDRRVRMAADVAEMEAMVAELLELERLRDGRGLQPVRQDLLPIVRAVADSFAQTPPGVRLRAAPSQVLLEIDGDKVRMVLRNLLENATKFSLPDSRPVEIVVTATDRHVTVRVRDDGPGVPEEDAGSLFEPFFRVDRSRSRKTGGYGLGLSICKRVMDAHGGSIDVERHASRGTSFVLTFSKPAERE